MQFKKIIYYVSKFTLIDEIVGFIYWALSIYGIFLIVENFDGGMVELVLLAGYIVGVVVVYLTIMKKIKIYFKESKL